MNRSYKYLFAVAISPLLLALAPVRSSAQDSSIENAITGKSYVFHAQTAIPQAGGARHLTTDYTLKVEKNVLISDLPFFGRAYSIPYGGGNGGFNFTSQQFDYTVAPRKKGGWQIDIKPHDVQDFREFILTVSSNGYATLQANSNNRQPISFTGVVNAPAEVRR
ncbi:MAG TPA: DUF4251 domain-containing protein [Chitinophagaceae bacterium]|jgi:hypothetical protein